MSDHTEKRFLRFPPELGDGERYVVAPIDALLEYVDHIAVWANESELGETLTIELVSMTAEDYDGLPEI